MTTHAPASRPVAGASPPTVDRAVVGPMAGELTGRDTWSRPELLALQRRRLDDALRHAVARSAFYRDTIGAAVEGRATLEDLPVLTKATLMDQWDRIVTDPRLHLRDVEAHLAGERPGDLLLGEYRACATGGTTGERAVILYDRSGWDRVVANILRWMRVAGATPETRAVGIGAPTPLHITNRAFAELRAGQAEGPRLSVLTPLPEITAALNDYGPEIIVTYPSFARRLVEEQESGRLRIRPRRICTTAEVVTAGVRALVRRAWGAKTLDSYGTTEAGLLGTECDAVAGIHIAEDMLVFEVVDEDDRPVAPGTRGSKVLLTTLFNPALPLVRYEISDLVTADDGPCACGRPFVRVTSIDGRREDYVRLRAARGGDLRVHAGRIHAPLAGIAGLRQFQLAPAFDHVLLRVAVRDGAREDEVAATAASTVRDALESVGADVDVRTEVVGTIDRVGTGAKERLVAAATNG